MKFGAEYIFLGCLSLYFVSCTPVSTKKIELAKSSKEIESQMRQTYLEKCASCHGKKGEGKVGPNLTDSYWISGDGSLEAIQKVITHGRPRRGMPGWSPILSEEVLEALSVWTFELQKTPVQNGKRPQGKKYGKE